MKFLAIADAASMHTYNYMKYILGNTDYEITIFSVSNKVVPDEIRRFYIERKIRVVYAVEPESKLAKDKDLIKRIYKLFKKVTALKNLGKFDIGQLEFINASGSILLWLCRKKYRFILLTYWGSDILQITNKLKLVQMLILRHANAITLCTEKMFRKFREEYGNKYDNKLYKVNIIVGTLNNIEKANKEYGVVNSKKYFNLPCDKKIVMCGYNGASAQQQDKIIEVLSSLKKKYRDQIYIIMPFMYGCSDKKYISRVKSLLAKSKIEYIVIERYLDYDEIARLSLASDIFLQLRFTDALSASMQEQLYAGTIVIRGSWLEYDELENTDLPIYKINTMDELKECVTSVLDNYNNINHSILPKYIYCMSSGEKSKEQSLKIYGNLI